MHALLRKSTTVPRSRSNTSSIGRHGKVRIVDTVVHAEVVQGLSCRQCVSESTSNPLSPIPQVSEGKSSLW